MRVIMKSLLLLFLFSLCACSTSSPLSSSRTIASIYSEVEKKYRCYYDDSFYFKSGYTLKTSKDKIYLNRTEIKPSENKYKFTFTTFDEIELIIIESTSNGDELFCKLI